MSILEPQNELDRCIHRHYNELKVLVDMVEKGEVDGGMCIYLFNTTQESFQTTFTKHVNDLIAQREGTPQDVSK